MYHSVFVTTKEKCGCNQLDGLFTRKAFQRPKMHDWSDVTEEKHQHLYVVGAKYMKASQQLPINPGTQLSLNVDEVIQLDERTVSFIINLLDKGEKSTFHICFFSQAEKVTHVWRNVCILHWLWLLFSPFIFVHCSRENCFLLFPEAGLWKRQKFLGDMALLVRMTKGEHWILVLVYNRPTRTTTKVLMPWVSCKSLHGMVPGHYIQAGLVRKMFVFPEILVYYCSCHWRVRKCPTTQTPKGIKKLQLYRKYLEKTYRNHKDTLPKAGKSCKRIDIITSSMATTVADGSKDHPSTLRMSSKIMGWKMLPRRLDSSSDFRVRQQYWQPWLHDVLDAPSQTCICIWNTCANGTTTFNQTCAVFSRVEATWVTLCLANNKGEEEIITYTQTWRSNV